MATTWPPASGLLGWTLSSCLKVITSKMNFGSQSTKAWKDIWGAGQGIGAISQVRSTADFVSQLRHEYSAARQRPALITRGLSFVLAKRGWYQPGQIDSMLRYLHLPAELTLDAAA